MNSTSGETSGQPHLAKQDLSTLVRERKEDRMEHTSETGCTVGGASELRLVLHHPGPQAGQYRHIVVCGATWRRPRESSDIDSTLAP